MPSNDRDKRKRARASHVRLAGGGRIGHGRARGPLLAYAAVALFFALLVFLVGQDELPVTLLGAYGVLSAIAFVMYGADKSAAQGGLRRTPEPTLHTIALVGGWPGALLGRYVFRHKTTKQPFRTVFWGTVIANCAALAWFVYASPLTLP